MPVDLTAYVETERRRADVAGTAVVAFDRDGVRFQAYFGHANIERGERVTPDTLFRAASISKLFTTTLVMQEVDAGRIGLDDPVNQHLDARTRIRNADGTLARGVTIRGLLTHTSGLPVSWKGLEYGNVLMRHVTNGLRLPQSLEDVVAGMRTIRAPGERIVYANGGFALLGHLVARLNERPFESLVKERVLDLLGMHDSGFVIEPSMPRLATSYGGTLRGAGRKEAPYVRNLTGPAGALVTTGPELARFGRMMLRGGEIDGSGVFPAALLRQAMELQARNHPELDDGWGLGFTVSEFRGRRAAGHDGGLAGVSTRLLTLPDEGIGVVVLTNGGDAAYVSRVAERVLETMLGLEPEAVPGSPAGIADALAPQWRTFTGRVTGRYRLTDQAPPGPLAFLMDRMVKVKVAHVAHGVLAVDGTGMGTLFLYPDGDVGRYRVAHPLANGARAVIDERADGPHLWISILHARRTK
jgi:CubicO group peptidase (beta-lactamase class C family)